jgi:hypothetical protein
MSDPHKAAFSRLREANKQSGNQIGEAIFGFLENEEPTPLDFYGPISVVPMPAPNTKESRK